ncbi:MAG: hypothetical protein MZU84_00095 [Sphingobacterium sp.]|nr:hypothetical protein [Sphingobacterium sp.]
MAKDIYQVVVTVRSTGSVIVTLVVSVQAFASVTATRYVPAASPVAVAVL